MKNLIIHWSNSEINSANVLDSGPSAFLIPAVVGGVVGGLVGIMVILGVAAVVYKKCLKKGNNGEEKKMSHFTMTIYNFIKY